MMRAMHASRPRRALIFLLALGPSACAGLLDIQPLEHVDPSPAPDATVDVTEERRDALPDATPSCGFPPFGDDFDRVGQPVQGGWSALAGTGPDATLRIVDDPGVRGPLLALGLSAGTSVKHLVLERSLGAEAPCVGLAFSLRVDSMKATSEGIMLATIEGPTYRFALSVDQGLTLELAEQGAGQYRSLAREAIAKNTWLSITLRVTYDGRPPTLSINERTATLASAPTLAHRGASAVRLGVEYAPANAAAAFAFDDISLR